MKTFSDIANKPEPKYRVVIPWLVISVVAVIIVLNGIFEYQRSKGELYDLMRNQAHSILTTIIASSHTILNIEGEPAEIKKAARLDSLIDKIIRPGEIVYYALQDTSGIILSSANVEKLDNIGESDFLSKAAAGKKFSTRIYAFNGRDIFEAAKKFEYKGENFGVLRIGLSLTYMNELISKAYNRILINSLIMFAGGIILVLIISIRKNYQMLQQQYRAVESLSDDVIKTVSDAVIVFNPDNKIKVFNKAAEELFGVSSEQVMDTDIKSVVNPENCPGIFSADEGLINSECIINSKIRNVLASSNTFTGADKKTNTVMVIRDLTEIKKLEVQLQRKERLTAMGALASGVAHEIRNPLNSIGTIAQQLNKDFEPAANKDEYQKLTRIIYGEVKRINETVTNFLRFAKPEPMNPEKFCAADLMNEIVNQYKIKFQEEGVELNFSSEINPEVFWDKDRIRQVIVNLIKNSKEAIEGSGAIKAGILKSAADDGFVEIRISDSGKGIPEEIKNKIFNLYFTTKASGTGIGLSIVQKIIDEHNGFISVDSNSSGTTFIIQLPKNGEGMPPQNFKNGNVQ